MSDRNQSALIQMVGVPALKRAGSNAGVVEEPDGEQGVRSPNPPPVAERRDSASLAPGGEKTSQASPSQWMRRLTVLGGPVSPAPAMEQTESYFKLVSGSGQTRAKQDHRLEFLRELLEELTKMLAYVAQRHVDQERPRSPNPWDWDYY